MHHNFIIGPTDTDSISFCKEDMSPFTKEELNTLLAEIKSISPEFMVWEDDGYYETCIALRAKNYVLWDGKKKKIKGSAFKTSSKEPALRDMMNQLVDAIINNKMDSLVDIYESYITEALHVTDIKRWASKKTITEAILNCRGWTEEDILEKRLRRNEVEVWEAIKHLPDLQEGNKVWVYPAVLGSSIERKEYKNGKVKEKVVLDTGLKSVDRWEGDHNSEKLIERVWATIEIFENLLDISQFIDYTKTKNKPLLEGR